MTTQHPMISTIKELIFGGNRKNDEDAEEQKVKERLEQLGYK
jgi:hypothetical protein